MASGPKKISQLTVATTFANADLILIVQNTAGTPINASINPNTILLGVSNYTANDVTYVGGISAANIVSNAQLQANLTSFAAGLTANNTNFVGSTTAANVVSNTQLQQNLANYVAISTLAANVGGLTSNNTKFVGTITAANIVSNAQLTANLSSYQTIAGLSANVATLTSNSTSFVGSVSAANIVSNAQLTANLSGYANVTNPTFSASVNVGSAILANLSGIYTTGVVNGAVHSVGATFIANSTVLTFTPNTFNLGSASKTANGYVWLPNGVLYQWGTVASNSSVGAVTFPIAFPTACQSVQLSVIGSANVAFHAAAANTTQANVRTTSTTTALSVQYTAIGY